MPKPSVAGTATIKVTSTGNLYYVHPKDLDWDLSETKKRSMGDEKRYDAVWERDGAKVVWTIWEYPADTFNDSDTDATGCTIQKDFSEFAFD